MQVWSRHTSQRGSWDARRRCPADLTRGVSGLNYKSAPGGLTRNIASGAELWLFRPFNPVSAKCWDDECVGHDLLPRVLLVCGSSRERYLDQRAMERFAVRSQRCGECAALSRSLLILRVAHCARESPAIDSVRPVEDDDRLSVRYEIFQIISTLCGD